jgi:PAS domain S-box-containing protein
LILFFLVLSLTLLAASDEAVDLDSLEQRLPGLQNRELLNALSTLTIHNLELNPLKSIEYGQRALELANSLKLPDIKFNLLSYLGLANEYTGDFFKALQYYQESLELAIGLENLKYIGSAYLNIAAANEIMNNYDLALDFNLQAKEVFEQISFELGVANALNNIGNVYLLLEQYEKAKDFYLQSLDLKKAVGEDQDLSVSYHNLALIYQEMGDYDNSMKHFDLALKIIKKKNDQNTLAVTYGNLANLYFLMGNYHTAYAINQEALQIYRNQGNKLGMSGIMTNQANVLLKLKQLNKAYEMLIESNKIAVELENLDLRSENQRILSEYYRELEDYENAYQSFKEHKVLSDSLSKELNRKKIAELSLIHEITQKEKEISFLKKEAVTSRRIRNGLILILVIGFILLAFLMYLYHEKIKDSKIKHDFQIKIKENELLYRTLTENLKTAVYTFNNEGKFTYVNPYTCQITGYSETELLKMRFFEFVHPDHHDMVMKRGMSRLKSEDVLPDYVYNIITKSGKIRWIETHTELINIDNNLLVLGTSIDITERFEANRMLAESESQLRALFSAMDDIIMMVDDKGTILSVAPTITNKLYKPKEEIIGKIPQEIFHAELAEIFSDKISKSVQENSIVTFNYEIEIKNKKYWYTGSLNPIDAEKVLFIGRDITEQHDSYEKLKESEKKYRSLVESIEEGMTILDDNFNFTFVNNAACKILGYSKSELLKMNARNIIPDSQKEILDSQQEERKKGLSGSYENWNYRKDGSKILVRVFSSPVFKDNVFAGSLSIFSDITKIRQAEQKIIASLREKEVMLQEIYHRVKNNMQIISSMLKLQSQYVTKENAQTVFQNCQYRVKAMSLVHEKLYRSKDLSKINARDYFTSLLKQLIASYRHHQSVDFAVNSSEDEISLSTAIPCGLIANELITNSLKHAFDKNGGKVFLNFAKLDDNNFKLEIGNDGKCFKEDFDLDKAETFGLQLVNILSKQLHAKFQLDCKEGVKFIFVFEDRVN